MIVNLIPMAGKGNRFIQERYNVAKPFVMVMNEPMIVASVKSFPPADKWVFICRNEHLNKLKKATSGFKSAVEVVEIDRITEGQACTCLLAEQTFGGDDVLFIASCDYQIIYDEKKYQALMKDPDIDVIIWTFKIGAIKKANPNAFAYCRTEGNRVIEVVEKRTISDNPANDPAVVGSFTYKKARLFSQGAQQMISKNIRVNNEFYVGTSINQLIEQGCNVVCFEVDKFISFGNPFELDLFYYWQEYFGDLNDHSFNLLYGYKGKNQA